ncbi:MAG: glycosyltransferase family 4 protein [Pseudomonadales bacterium]|nr:glycosyltransferase family 4 protein [Pseudomonadales bacterium]
MPDKPYIMLLGLRGIPEVEGGIETHVQYLAPRLVELGCKVEVLSRSPYHLDSVAESWQGVKITPVWAPKSNSFETLIHTFLGTLLAAFKRPDVLHFHAIGPALLVPVARLLGLRVVVTHHGSDYEREKWGWFASNMLKFGERFGMKLSNAQIVISKTIRAQMLELYGKPGALIPNGVVIPDIRAAGKLLESFGLQPQRYILQVSRFVPEKRQLELIQAYSNLSAEGWKLVLVGSLESGDEYIGQVKELADRTDGVVLTGFQKGEALEEIYANAGVFVLPSSHEGLPIALLEALSYGLRVLASNISANLEIGLAEQHYFPLGDLDILAEKLSTLIDSDWCPEQIDGQRKYIANTYNWDDIARQTHAVYEQVTRH